ncbi:MAG: Na(+)/H(+) antiporter subunit B [Coriobacteriia bacterium]
MMLAFDVLLAALLVWIAFGSLSELKLFKSVVMFVVFGLFMALAWVRLGAPDVALAEAAIGAGVTGALMLDAVGHMRERQQPYPVTATKQDAPDA